MLCLTNRKQHSMLYTPKDHKNGVKIFKTQVEPSFKHYTEYEMIDSQIGKKNPRGLQSSRIQKNVNKKTIAVDTFKNSSNLFCHIMYWLRYNIVYMFCVNSKNPIFFFEKTSSFLTAKSKPINV